MKMVELSQATSALSRLIDAIEQGREREIIISRDGRPVAKLVSLQTALVERRLGLARGAFEVPETIDARSEEIAKRFSTGGDS